MRRRWERFKWWVRNQLFCDAETAARFDAYELKLLREKMRDE